MGKAEPMTSGATPTAVVGRNVERARMKAGLTRDELAVFAGVAASTIYRIETGVVAPGAHTLSRIAFELGVTVDFLLRGES